jgi:hypothetical protein
MRRFPTALALAFLFASGCARRAPEAVEQAFESNDGGWIPYGPDAQVEVTRDPAFVKNGTAALALHYKYNPGQYGSAVLPLEAGQFARTPGLRFWIRADIATPVVVSEKQPGGGYYSSWFWCPKGAWQQVELAPSDFILNTGPDDPKDPDGRLDLDRVNGIGISDLGQAFQTVGVEQAYPLVVERGSGEHTIAVDDFQMGPAASGESANRLIGGVERGFLTWITMGGAQLEIAGDGNPLSVPALRAAYARVSDRSVLITHTLANVNLGGATRLGFRMASANDSTFVVYLEEKLPGSALGPRYASTFTVPGGSRATDQALAFSSFAFDKTGPADADGRLTPGQLKSISFIDISAAQGAPAGTNTIWIGPLRPQ